MSAGVASVASYAVDAATVAMTRIKVRAPLAASATQHSLCPIGSRCLQCRRRTAVRVAEACLHRRKTVSRQSADTAGDSVGHVAFGGHAIALAAMVVVATAKI